MRRYFGRRLISCETCSEASRRTRTPILAKHHQRFTNIFVEAQFAEKLEVEATPPGSGKPDYAPVVYAGSGPPEEEKVFLSSKELRKLIFDQLDPMLDRRSTVYLADANYYCTPIDNAMEIIGLSQVEHRTWIDEVFDCDDFAHMFKGKFLESAYKNGQRRTPHCFGIVWGTIDGGSHAFNWMVNSDMLLRFVEPQDYDVIEIDRKKSDIQLMIA